MPNHDLIDVTVRVATELERLQVRYLVGGSIASSYHGIPRFTEDADLVAELPLDAVDPLVAGLANEFYVDAGMIRDAIQHVSEFNVIHLESFFKVDVFIFKHNELGMQEMDRRIRVELPEGSGTSLFMASAEDIILQKLHWFLAGNRISDRQWSDVLGVLNVAGSALDREYLRTVARTVGPGLADVLEEALGQT